MNPARVRLELEDGVATLILNRPDKRNAIDLEMLRELNALCDVLEEAEDVRVAILTGSGDRAFCAGGDIDAWGKLSPAAFAREWLRPGHAVFDRLCGIRQLSIAVLNGDALGGGLELAATADLRIAEEHIKISMPEAGLGIIPGWSGTQRAVRRFGVGPVRRMALFGEVFNASEALALGLVDHVAPRNEGLTAARKIARQVKKRAPIATELVKSLINSAEGEDRGAAIETLAGAAAAASDDLREGLNAFSHKRKPDFSRKKDASND